VLVGGTGSVHLLSTWDEGIPDDIPRENLYGISFNAMNFVKALQGIEGAGTVRTVATDALTPSWAQLLLKAFPSADLIDGEPFLRRVRRLKTSEEVDAIRASVRIAESALSEAEAALAPGMTERQLTGVFMEAMASSGVTTPAGQDVAWITSRQHPWHRASRDTPVVPGDLVVYEAGVILDGYVGELGRTRSVEDDSAIDHQLLRRWSELSDRLLAACRLGAPLTDLLDAYDAVGIPPPPMPVARGLGLGFDLPLATHALRRTAAEQELEAGMVLTLSAFVWKEGVGALYGQVPLVMTATGPELLSTIPPAIQGASLK
jgi:Xaa-Pro aminopeptidase